MREVVGVEGEGVEELEVAKGARDGEGAADAVGRHVAARRVHALLHVRAHELLDHELERGRELRLCHGRALLVGAREIHAHARAVDLLLARDQRGHDLVGHDRTDASLLVRVLVVLDHQQILESFQWFLAGFRVHALALQVTSSPPSTLHVKIPWRSAQVLVFL